VRSVVRIYPGPPTLPQAPTRGAVAQLGEHLLCKQGVNGSIPFSSTRFSFTVSRSLPGLVICNHSGTDLETGQPVFGFIRAWPKGFLTASGRRRSRKRRLAVMFDNEIDWVIAHRALIPRTVRREAGRRMSVAMTRIQGRAHCRAANV
jgi:hypothetical protein